TSEVYPALKYHDDTCDTSYPSPDCGKLLLYQHTGLRDIKIEQNGLAVQLSPSFHTTRTNYTATVGGNTNAIKITPIALNPDARIIADGKILAADSSSYLMPLNTVGPTSTVIRVFAQDSLRSEEPIDYKVTISNRSPMVTIQAPDLVYEGDVVRLNASIVDYDGDKLNYRLTATADILADIEAPTGEVVGRADLSFTFNIPTDLIDAMQLRHIVELALTVDDGQASVTEKVLLTIIKENNGVIPIPTPTRQGFVYIIPDIDLSADMDGVNSVPIPTYQWQSEIGGSWIDIEGATNPSYTVVGVVGDRYRVVVDYTDKQGYEHQGLASPPVAAAAEEVVYSANIEDTNEDISGMMIQLKVFLEGLFQ
ncbi:MAG: cadherin-like beta sandwich domain-containing protein, partial [Gammaproteobacteria bacterium]|nr:cadherin-like beta sandwich domain-containing protein [Gammaproteobacteria bacterium]